MKISKKALQLIDKGMTAKTVSKLTESQVNTLHSRLFLSEQVEEMPAKKSYKVGQEGGNLPPSPKGYNVKKTPTGDVVATPNESELGEEEEVAMDPNKDVETQDPHQVGPSSDDGFGDETDGMGMMENEEKIKKGEPNPYSICHSQVGPKKSRKWERCVKAVKKQLAEGKNPVSLFLEAQIMNIVEKNLQPRITKGDLVKYLSEGDNFATKHLQSWGNSKPAKVKSEVGENSPATAPSKPKTSPTTKPGKPGTKPQRPPSPFKNPNPGEKESPKAKKVSPEQAKDEVLDVIMQILQK
jgi:hypothetical protein